MPELPIIQIYISYNTVHKKELEALEKAFKIENESANASYNMVIKYSENSLAEGDSIVEFMDEIAVVRFVVLFFSKEYFESPYCLYELITAYDKKNIAERSFVLPIKFGNLGAAINTYTIEDIINAWQGKGDLSECTRKKGKDFCQNKLRERLQLEDDQIKTQITTVRADVIKPWLDKNIPEKTSDEIVQEVVEKVKQVFDTEEKEFNKFILKNIKHELGYIKNLGQSWENFSGDSIKKEEIANRLMEGDYSTSFFKIQAWAKAEKHVTSPAEWRSFFNRIQKISGWFALKSINQDWWINNQLSFTDGAKNQGFVKLGLEKKHFSYSEVVVSKVLRKYAQFTLDDQNKLQPLIKEYAIREGHDMVYDSKTEATLHTLLIPIVTDLRKTQSQTQNVTELFDDLLEIAATNIDSFFI